ncbi:phage distal tail protein [Solibacillus silvestris]
MAIFEFVSKRGDRLSLSNGENYKLVNIDGQTAAKTDISSVVTGGSDGDFVNNVQAQPRPIVIDLRIIADVENTKRSILDVIKIEQEASLLWTQENRTVEIKGIVESIDMPRWTETTIMQITLHCSQPFWEDINQIITEINEAISLHYFTEQPNDMLYFPAEGIVLGEYDTTRTREIHNQGDVAVGLEIEILALRQVINPIIYNGNGEFFGCGYGSGNKRVVMNTGDHIVIKTGKDEKSVTFNGQSILSKIKPKSTWLQLAAGDNIFSINDDSADLSNVTFSLIYKRRYI